MTKITANMKLQAVMDYAKTTFETIQDGVQAFKVNSVQRVSADCYKINMTYLKSGREHDYTDSCQCFKFFENCADTITAEPFYGYTNDDKNTLWA